MEFTKLYDWPQSKADAYAYQAEIAKRVEIVGNTDEPKLIAAIDTDYGAGGETLYAAAVVLDFPNLTDVDRSLYSDHVTFPYVPGLFYYREGPVIVETLKRLKTRPDVVIVSGHGIAHPKRCGIACHIGIDFDIPSIGCSRRLLAGTHRPPAETKGSVEPIILQGKEVGVVYRSKDSVKPIYISPGHKCDLAYSRDLIIRCLRGYRLPEPLRIAHLLANKYRQRSERTAGNRITREEHGDIQE